MTTTQFFTAADEGRVIPAVPLGFNFPMAGAFPLSPTPGFATHVFLESNGQIYLTNNFYGLARPLGAFNFGLQGVFDWRGGWNTSPRIAAWTGDLDAGNGANWGVYADTSIPNQATFYWQDIYDFGAAVPGSYSFSVTLYVNGDIDFSYSGLGTFNPAPFAKTIGVSIGNEVGTGLEVSQDLDIGADSGSVGMLFEEFFGNPNDLENKTLRISPNGIGGFQSTVVCVGAFHQPYGEGCYKTYGSFYEWYTDAVSASAALQGNAMQLTPAGNGYAATWLPGGAALYVTPSLSATTLPPGNDGDDTITPSIALTLPSGTATDITISHNGIITAAAFGNNSFDWTPDGEEFADATELAFYHWSDFFDGNTTPVPSGLIKYEEIANVLYITFDQVDHYASPFTTCPSTIQFQLDLVSGVVTYVWVTVDTNTTSFDGDDHLVGYTDAGASVDPGSISLATSLPLLTGPDLPGLALSASPPPVFSIGNPSVPVTWTADNVPDIVPPFGIGISLLIFSVAPFPGGLDMGFLGMPGCNLNIASLDVTLSMPGTAPSTSVTLSIPQPLSQGLSFYSQVLSLFPPNSLPGGQNAFGGLLSNGLQSSFNIY